MGGPLAESHVPRHGHDAEHGVATVAHLVAGLDQTRLEEEVVGHVKVLHGFGAHVLARLRVIVPEEDHGPRLVAVPESQPVGERSGKGDARAHGRLVPLGLLGKMSRQSCRDETHAKLVQTLVKAQRHRAPEASLGVSLLLLLLGVLLLLWCVVVVRRTATVLQEGGEALLLVVARR